MQTKQKKQSFKKFGALLLATAVAAVSLAGISAYFTATDQKTNTFTVGKISIDLQEPAWKGEVPTTPNQTVEKDPQILNDGNEDAYVYLTVDVPYANVEVADANGNVSAAADTELFSYTTNPGWVEIGTATKDETKGVYKHVYAYAADADTLTVLEPEATTAKLFNEVKFANVVETPDDDGSLKDLLEGINFDIVVNAYGIETEIIGGEVTPEYVWSIITNQTIANQGGSGSEAPVLLEGNGSVHSTFAVNDLRFRSSAPMNEFQEVQVNGVTVDPQYYSVSEGSTVINLSGEYLKTLNADEHDISIVSDSGAAEGTFFVETPVILEAGLYDENDTLIADWGTLVNTYGLDIETDNTYASAPESLQKDTIASKILSQDALSNGVKLVISEDVTKLGKGQFVYNTTIKEVVIPKGVTSISFYSFKGCTNLETVNIESGITSIDGNAFEGTSLQSVIIPNTVTTISGQAFRNCKSLSLLTLGSGITSIANETFMGCSNLTTVSLLDGISSLGARTFAGCSSLTEIVIPNGITAINSCTFEGCTNLNTIILPKTLTSIAFNTFKGCTSLTSIYIPESVSTMYSVSSSTDSPFYGCSPTLKIYCGATESQSGWGTYWNYYDNTNPLDVTYGTTRAEYETIIAE